MEKCRKKKCGGKLKEKGRKGIYTIKVCAKCGKIHRFIRFRELDTRDYYTDKNGSIRRKVPKVRMSKKERLRIRRAKKAANSAALVS